MLRSLLNGALRSRTGAGTRGYGGTTGTGLGTGTGGYGAPRGGAGLGSLAGLAGRFLSRRR